MFPFKNLDSKHMLWYKEFYELICVHKQHVYSFSIYKDFQSNILPIPFFHSHTMGVTTMYVDGKCHHQSYSLTLKPAAV